MFNVPLMISSTESEQVKKFKMRVAFLNGYSVKFCRRADESERKKKRS